VVEAGDRQSCDLLTNELKVGVHAESVFLRMLCDSPFIFPILIFAGHLVHAAVEIRLARGISLCLDVLEAWQHPVSEAG
jgi:hypothetical protein